MFEILDVLKYSNNSKNEICEYYQKNILKYPNMSILFVEISDFKKYSNISRNIIEILDFLNIRIFQKQKKTFPSYLQAFLKY